MQPQNYLPKIIALLFSQADEDFQERDFLLCTSRNDFGLDHRVSSYAISAPGIGSTWDIVTSEENCKWLFGSLKFFVFLLELLVVDVDVVFVMFSHLKGGKKCECIFYFCSFS